MSHTLGEFGRALAKVLFSGLIVLAIGVSSAPDLNAAKAAGVAAFFGIVGGLVSVVQVFFPSISFRAWIPDPWGPMFDSFAHAFIGAFLISITGFLQAPDLSTWKAVVVGAIVGAINAGFRAVQGVFTPGERPSPVTGFDTGAAEPQPGPVTAPRTSAAGRKVLLPA